MKAWKSYKYTLKTSQSSYSSFNYTRSCARCGVPLSDLLFYSENLNSKDEELIEGDMKFLPGQARGSVPTRLWPNGDFIYDIESSLSK